MEAGQAGDFRMNVAAGTVAPRTRIEHTLLGVWREVLGVPAIGVRDNFFALGGQSLQAVRMLSRVRATFQIQLPIQIIFDHPTIEGLAAQIESRQGGDVPEAAQPILRAPAGQDSPASFGQEQLWFFDQFHPDSCAYNVPVALRISGSLQPAIVERALTEIVARHESLRTVFTAGQGRPMQRILPAQPVRLEVIDLRAGAEAGNEALRLAKIEARRPFDLTADLMLRATCYRVAPSEHVLLLVLHHIASDAWSMEILFEELFKLYSAFAEGKPSPLPPLPIQFADFAAWQHRSMDGAVLEREIDWWRRELAGVSLQLELPADRPRPAVPGHRGAIHSFDLSAVLREKLSAIVRQEDATLFLGLLATFHALVRRYTGQDDVVIGTPVFGRNRAETEKLIGFFVNSVPLRVNLSGKPAFRELLRRVREAARGAYAHQDLPFPKLVEAMRPERDASAGPIFQVMFAPQDAPRAEWSVPGLVVERVGIETDRALFDLTLYWEETASGLRGSLEYDTDLFDAPTIARLAGHYLNLLEAAAADLERSLAEVPLLTGAERTQLLETWNATDAPFPRDATLHGLFEAQAGRTPEALALAQGDARITYVELNRRAVALAGQLQRAGVSSGALVAVCAGRSIELVVGLLAVLKAGGAYVPIDPDWPAERTAFVLRDTQAPVVLALASFQSRLAGLAATFIALDQPVMESDGKSAPVASGDLAYVIYTSGSTGELRGVAVEHRSVINLCEWHRRAYAVTSADRATLIASPAFDASVWELWPYLISGASVHIPDDATRLVPEDLLGWLVAEKVTVSFLPTPMAEAVLAEKLPSGLALRALLTGGDKLHRVPERELPFQLVNHYGPTENTVVSTRSVVRAGELSAPLLSAPPIGRPIDNTQCYVLDAQLQPVPIGVPGELCVSGVGLARGYWNRPELTAEKFVPHPFRGGERLYHTGDRVRWRADGEIEFLGRFDDQVKVRGFRIEIGEIECALLLHPGLRAAAVALHGDEEKKLIGYVVPRNPRAVTSEELRQFLAQRLPAYMLPSAFVMMEALPMLPSGKVDRRALPKPGRVAGDSSRPGDVHTGTERVIAQWTAELLKLERVGMEDNFFALGGHSLLATQLVSRLRAELKVELPLASVFSAPTLGALAGEVERLLKKPQPARTNMAPIQAVARQGEFPLSSAQERLWFFDQLLPGNPSYNIVEAMRLRGPLDEKALEAAFDELVRRHETLRTTFKLSGEAPVQVVAASQPVAWRVEEMSGLPEHERSEAVKRRSIEEGLHAFDLAKGPLLRVLLLKAGADDHSLIWTVHHIVSDGWSRGVFLRELTLLYGAFVAGSPSPLAPIVIQYADYAQWQRQWLGSEEFQRQMSFWQEQLGDGVPALELPTDHPRPAMQTFRGAAHAFTIPRKLTDALKALSAREGATLFMTTLTVFQALLSRYAGQDDIVVGTPVANRQRAELEGLIGFMANTLVLRGDVSGDPVFREALQRVRATALRAFENQDLPFEKLVEVLNPERDLSHQPLFQVMFVLQNAPAEALRLGNLTLEPLSVDTGMAMFDLTLCLEEAGGELQAILEYNADLFDGSTIGRLAEHYLNLLDSATNDPSRRLSELPMLREAERCKLLEEWSGRRTEYPRDRCVQELFEDQARLKPQAIALELGDDQVSYRELNQRANRLARHLRNLGVGPETVVGVCLERSMDLVVALLGVLKAGGAYLPLDPGYPGERLRFMLADAQAPVLIARKGKRDWPNLGSLRAVVCVEDDAEIVLNLPPDDLAKVGTAESLAYIMYTSGSTGDPKGVCVPHRAIVRLVMGTDYAHFGPDETFLLASPASFDASTLELWGSLLHGAKLVIAPAGPLALDELGGLIRAKQVTTVWLTADLFRLMVEERMDDLRGLRQLLAGGDVLSLKSVNQALSKNANFRLINGYGPTESTTFACCHVMQQGEQFTQAVPIGRPIANTQAFILDRHLQPVPMGVPGELYLGGDGLARGYLHRAPETEAKFIPHPFSEKAGARIYRTGDQARWREDGTIEFLGRRDRQIKLRGYRVELSEIESALEHHGEVKRAFAMVQSTAAGEKQIAAYCESKSTPIPGARELRDFLRQRLPEHMIPSVVMVVPALPLTDSGKVDWRALRELETSEPESAGKEPHGDPDDLLEVRLKQIWETVLGRSPIRVDDNFFDLGGHSLLAVKLFVQIEKALGVRLPLATLFQAPTVARLAAALRSEGWNPPWSSLVPVKPGGTRAPYFIIHGLGGNVLNLRHLAHYMGDDLPVYGLQSQGLDGKAAPPTSIEEMAAHYVREIRTIQPHGPYFLGGMSFGGVVAWEMAQQLSAAGEPIGLLTLLDSYPLGYSELLPITERTRREIRFYSRRLKLHFSSLWHLTIQGKWEYVKKKARTLQRRLKSRAWRALRGAYAARGGELPEALHNVKEANFLAARDYVTKPYSGRVTLFVASQQPLDGFFDLEMTWKKLAGSVETIQVPGDHSTVIEEPNVRVLAARLKDCVVRAQTGLESDRIQIVEPRNAVGKA